MNYSLKDLQKFLSTDTDGGISCPFEDAFQTTEKDSIYSIITNMMGIDITLVQYRIINNDNIQITYICNDLTDLEYDLVNFQRSSK